ncbi:alpha/beta hydrolase family protein [Frateuria aurantia]
MKQARAGAVLLASAMATAAVGAQELCRSRATDLRSALQHQDAATAEAHFTAALRAALPPSQLQALWSVQRPGHGAAEGAEEPMAGRGWAGIPLAADAMLQLSCDDRGQIIGLHLVRRPAAPLVLAPDEQQVVVASPLGPLTGVLTLPRGAGPFPAMLLVAGSGPQDHDESIGPNRPLRDLAQGLAAAGIASLRYDKRSFAHGPAMAGQAFSIDDEVTDDAVTALALLRRVPEVDPHAIFVAGHSLGGMMAPRIAQRSPGVAGLVMLAAPARSLLEVSLQQTRVLGRKLGLTPAQIAVTATAVVSEQQRLREAGAGQPLPGRFGGQPQSYWLSQRDYDQLAVARELRLPVLVLQGDADFQVSPRDDYVRWRRALQGRPGSAFHLYPGLNHLFTPAGTTGTPADYAQPARLAPQVAVDIAAWVDATVARDRKAARTAGD